MLVHYRLGEERARAVAEELGGAPVAQADLTVEADVERLFAEARAALGPVEVCAAVAGVYPEEDLRLGAVPRPVRAGATREPRRDLPHCAPSSARWRRASSASAALVLVGSAAGRFGEAEHADYAAREGSDQGRPPPVAEERGGAARLASRWYAVARPVGHTRR